MLILINLKLCYNTIANPETYDKIYSNISNTHVSGSVNRNGVQWSIKIGGGNLASANLSANRSNISGSASLGNSSANFNIDLKNRKVSGSIKVGKFKFPYI